MALFKLHRRPDGTATVSCSAHVGKVLLFSQGSLPVPKDSASKIAFDIANNLAVAREDWSNVHLRARKDRVGQNHGN